MYFTFKEKMRSGPPVVCHTGSSISSYYKHDIYISSAKRVEAVALVGAVLYYIVIATPQVSLTSCYRYYRHYNSCALPTTTVTTQLLLP